MIFIVTEQIMNGSVTLKVITKGIEAKTFCDAVKHLRKLLGYSDNIQAIQGREFFNYVIEQKGILGLCGSMTNNPLEMI